MGTIVGCGEGAAVGIGVKSEDEFSGKVIV
jgi:hypothetical protein